MFVEGQNVPEAEEMDGKEDLCRHYLGYVNAKPAATARVMPLDRCAKIQRVAVLETQRGTGLGAKLMQFILDDLPADFDEAVLDSQTHAIGFYETLGFKAFGPEFDDAGIPHRKMSLVLDK